MRHDPIFLKLASMLLGVCQLVVYLQPSRISGGLAALQALHHV